MEQREAERQTDRQRQRDREKERQRETETKSNSNSNTLILKDSSVKLIWTHLRTNPCYTISTTIRQTDIISTNKQLINAVSLSSYNCAKTSRGRKREGD